MPVFRLLDGFYTFPPPELAEPNGLLAVGGALDFKWLLSAYSKRIFPWFGEGEEIMWWCPRERFLIFPRDVHISGSMKKFMRREELAVRFDFNFEDVIANCAAMREDTWITREMIEAYADLHMKGYALCVSVYDGEKLVGGLYGVTIGRCFFGESMFSRVKNASKLALIRLCEKLGQEGFLFIDCQFHTPHLESMGGKYVSWADFKKMLREGINNDASVWKKLFKERFDA